MKPASEAERPAEEGVAPKAGAKGSVGRIGTRTDLPSPTQKVPIMNLEFDLALTWGVTYGLPVLTRA